jgi:8-amino-7-oxononanoate synthase
VNPVVTPAVPPGSAMIRTSYMATHTREHLDRALEAFEKVGRALGVIP